MPIVSTSSEPVRTILNSYVENLHIKDIEDNFAALSDRKSDKEAHLLVETFWITLKKILDDADSIGYDKNEAIKNCAVENSLKMIDSFIEIIIHNNVPEEDLQDYCVYQIEMVLAIIKRYGITEDYLQQLAACLVKHMKSYVAELKSLQFEVFYKFAQKLEIENFKEHSDLSMRELGLSLYVDLIDNFIMRFKEDEEAEVRIYMEELAYLYDKAKYFGFLSSDELVSRMNFASLEFIDSSMERKYQEKKVVKEIINQLKTLLEKYEIITEEFWNGLTEIIQSYLKIMADQDEREIFKFYWLYSQELELLDRTGAMPDRSQFGSVTSSSQSSKPKKAVAKKQKRAPRATGGLQEL